MNRLTVLYVMATEAEYGPELRQRTPVMITGVGPVEAAIKVTQRVTLSRPNIVVSLGSAGSRTLQHLGLYQVKSVQYRDMDASALGYTKGRTPFLPCEPELYLHTPVPEMPTARLSTGAKVISDSDYESIDADMVDMETYAIHRACMECRVPHIAFRGISDGKTPLKDVEDWKQSLAALDKKLAELVDFLEENQPYLPRTNRD